MKKLPYLPVGREILYVKPSNAFLLAAKTFAEEFSLDPAHPTGAVIVSNGKIIGSGANGTDHHEQNGCERKRQNISTGKGYDLCDGCHPKNHAEQTAIANAQSLGASCDGADLYLSGHWWCCESCWDAMIAAGIKNVYLCEEAKPPVA